MKASAYNELFYHNGNFYIYNILHDSLISISEKIKQDFEKSNFENLDPPILKQLIENGFITDIDELEYLKFLHNKLKYDNSKHAYLIYPTLTCNLDCPYCFEKIHRKKMTKEQLLILRKFLLSKAEDIRNTSLAIRWSGGEPLLLWSDIKSISEELNTICKKNNIKFSMSLCTNGTLISEKIASEIYKLNFSSVTISIDGPKHIHNKRRFYKNNNGSFDNVLDGVNNLSKYMNVVLRVNIDRINHFSYENLLVELNERLLFKDNISIYLKPVTAACDSEFDETMYIDTDFFEIENELIEITKNNGFKLEIHPGYGYSTRCLTYQTASYAIDPELQLFKCPIYIGRCKDRVGIINSNSEMVIEKENECINYVNISPFDNEECRKCRVLPLCHGKCIIKWQQLNFKINQGCIPEKGTIISKIKNYLLPNYID